VGGAIEVTTSPDVFHAVREKIEQAGFNIANAELAWVPSTTVKLEGKEAEGMLRLIGKIEELDDVNGVYGNHEIDEATIVKFNAAGA
jgi:transcriptional/translational regulatory protein YebC/TACO1